MLAALLAAGALGAACTDSIEEAPPRAAEPLKIGLLVDFSGGLAIFTDEMQRGFNLAVDHVNAAGGVLGRPLRVLIIDSRLDPEHALIEAQRMVDSAGVHALVGPLSSLLTLPIAERVSGPAGVPQITMGTSPALSSANDNDFLFRATLSDTTLAPVLARQTAALGFERIAVIHRADTWGTALATAFEREWRGSAEWIAVDVNDRDFSAALDLAAEAGAQALVLLLFAQQTEEIVRQALDSGRFDQFVLGPGGRSRAFIDAIGVERVAGQYGVGAGGAGDTAARRAWEQSFAEAYGRAPLNAYVRETYDAVIALALAAQAAGSIEGAAIRGQLRSIASAPGTAVLPGPDGVAEGLRLAAAGQSINYEGASTALDWDEHGDPRSGHVVVWQITADGAIAEVESIPYP